MAHKKETNADGADRAGADDKLSASSAMECVSSAWFALFFACFFFAGFVWCCPLLVSVVAAEERKRNERKRYAKCKFVGRIL